MTTPSRPQQLTNGRVANCDDLTKIKGIGQARQQYLREAVGICTFYDLANVSAQELSSHLRAEEKTVSEGVIQNWIAQAQEFVVEPSLENTEEPTNTETASPAPDLVNHDSQKPIADLPDLQIDWETLASFTVDFQTKVVGEHLKQRLVVRHLETGMADIGADLKDENIYQWMQQQITPALSALSDAMAEVVVNDLPDHDQPDESPVHIGSSVVVKILQVEIVQPSLVESAIVFRAESNGVQGFIKSRESFTLEVCFRVPEQIFNDKAHRSAIYQAQVYARNLKTGKTLSLGESEPDTLVAGKFTYLTSIPDIVLAEPGIFRLQTLVTLQNTSSTPGYLEVPLIQVV